MTDARCNVSTEQLGALIDGELDKASAETLRRHVDDCPTCRASIEAMSTLGDTLRTSLGREDAPDTLRARIRHTIRVHDSARPSRLIMRWKWHAAAAVVLIAGSSAVTIGVLRRSDNVDAAVAAHIQALSGGHLADVASTDEHNLKPWFDGRVPFAPDVPRLDSLGFPLIGGRVDTLDHRLVAALVYGRRKHIIDVFVRPAVARIAQEPGTTFAQRGYNVRRWQRGDLEYIAVSDLAIGELDQFAIEFQGVVTSNPK